MFEQIEKLKQDFTDQYVVVDASIPELARFAGRVGQVKTVNMSGRALVEFDAWSNIGWYDIALDCLKVVPKPELQAEQPPPKRETPPKQAPQSAGAAPGEKKLSPLEMARLQGGAQRAGESPAPASGGAKQSTADILAAARAAKGAASGAPAGEKSPPPAKAKLSTADILAAARAKKSAEAQAQAPAQAPAPTAPGQAAPQTAEEQDWEKSMAAEAAPQEIPARQAAAPPVLPKGERPSVSQIIAWCREHDAK